MDHPRRRARLRTIWQQAAPGSGRLLITAPEDVRYLTGFTGSNGQVLIGPDPAADVLLTDARYLQRAATEAPGLPVVLTAAPGTHALHLLDHERTCTAVVHTECARPSDDGVDRTPGHGAPDRPAKALVIDPDHTSWSAARRLQQQSAACGVTLVPITGLVSGLRMVKDDGEIARLRRACEVTVQALTWLCDEVVAVGRSERELARQLEHRMLDLGADGIGFPSIVASGPNSAIAHHTPTDRTLRNGDLLTIDCGATVDGYHADYTRTVAIGALTDELVEVHALVVAAQAAGRAAAVAGAPSSAIDGAARGVIEEAGFGPRFIHGTGHGVGLEIHEAPVVARSAAATLVAGMTLTVEPGVYLPGVGGVRIEDTIVIAADGPAQPLTDTPRGLRVLA